MTGQGRRRSVVTAALAVVICGSMWLGLRTSAEAAMLLLEWAPAPLELPAPPPAQDFISEMQIVPEGDPVILEAVTDPPGYEDEITWLSSVPSGSGVPIVGRGGAFTVPFDDTWGPHPEDGERESFGVGADDVVPDEDRELCNDIVDFTAECFEGELIAIVTFVDPSHDGETVLVVIEDWGIDVPIVGSQAMLIETDIVGDNVEVWIAETGCEDMAQFVLCGGALRRHCKVTVDEVSLLGGCEIPDCPIGDTYCTKIGCSSNAICENINQVTRRCTNGGRCVGTTIPPGTCTCP